MEKVKKAQVWDIVKRVFPDYRGRKFRLAVTDHVTLYNLNWDGGSRNQYAAVQITAGQTRVFGNMPAPWSNPVEGLTLELKPDVAVVRHSIFCGYDTGITVYLNRPLLSST